MPHENPIKVKMRVEQENGMVIVNMRFENAGKRSALVKRGMLGFGKRAGESVEVSSMLNEEFAIVCDGVRIPYVGAVAKWSKFSRKHFDLMQPGDVIATRRVRIDDIYTLPPAARTCWISHVHYQFDEASETVTPVISDPTAFQLAH
ncbi:MAG: hypothetical protein WKG03_04270 [Telluria sp.]